MNFQAMLLAGGLTALSLFVGLLLAMPLRVSSHRFGKFVPGALMLTGLVAGHAVTNPWQPPPEIESALLELPIYAALKQHEPLVYNRLLATLLPIGSPTSSEGLRHDYKQMAEVILVRLPNASDDVIADHVGVTLRLAKHLHARQDGSCHAMVNADSSFQPNPVSLLDKASKEDYLNVMARVIHSSAGTRRAVVSEAEVAGDLRAIVVKLLERYSNDDVALLETPLAEGIDRNRYCEVLIAMTTEILAMPADGRSRVLRFMSQP